MNDPAVAFVAGMIVGALVMLVALTGRKSGGEQ